jgi:hypothetical protein
MRYDGLDLPEAAFDDGTPAARRAPLRAGRGLFWPAAVVLTLAAVIVAFVFG